MHLPRQFKVLIMIRIRTITDIDEGREIWQAMMPGENVTDLWEVRNCFHEYYHRPLNFIVAEEGSKICGFLPLSRIDEKGILACFPGETWQGTTWLEQNRVLAGDRTILNAMLQACPLPYHLRYLSAADGLPGLSHVVDEIGYLFNPPKYEYDFEKYFGEFSHKSEKRLKRDLSTYAQRNIEYRNNELSDFDKLVDLNIERFGFGSYFFDTRFRESFRNLMHLFHDNGWLRLTTISIDGAIAAIDLGCIYNGTYTLFAGGTNYEFPGIAKLINIHHMQYACEQKFQQVDFLCGDFAWKKLFHLDARPLYLLTNSVAVVPEFSQDAAASEKLVSEHIQAMGRQ